jgi:hypothetical protein
VDGSAAANAPGALLAEIPAAEPLVGRWRERLDANARLGIPAHVTVTYPFVAAGEIDAPTRQRLTELFGSVPSFGFVLDHVGWFEAETMWLGPRDPAPFRALTDRVFAEFPAYPPFEGQYDEVIPHLTVGHRQPVAGLRAAAAAVRPQLPIEGVVRAVSLWTQTSNQRWQRTAAFGLA